MNFESDKPKNEPEDPALAAWNAGYDDGFSGINLGSPDPDYTDDYESGRAEGKKDRAGVK